MNLILIMRRFTVRTRMLGTALIVGLALLTVAAVGIGAQFHARNVSNDFITHHFAPTASIAELRLQMSNLRNLEKDMLVYYGKTEQVKTLREAWGKAFAKIVVDANALNDRLVDPAQKAQVADAMTRLTRFKGRFESVAKTLESDGFDSPLGAATFMKRAQSEYDGAQTVIATLAGDIAKAANQGAVELDATSGMIVYALGDAVGLMLVVIVPVILINMVSIVRPIRNAEDLAKRIEAGDLSARDVDVRGRDEAANLLGALERMRASLAAMVGQVRLSTDSINTASTEIASGNQDLSARTEQTASNLQQAASSMEQLTGTVRQSADSARQANQLATSAAEVAARGGNVVSQVVTTMDEINNSSKKIADIIGVIDGIAFQTNILALNAAVEAARAGEQGRGFAVVASEVRSLAQRSAQAAKEIKGLIGASVERVEAGSRLVADAGKTMHEIVGSVQRVTDIIGEITAASTEQSDGIGQVSTAVGELDRMTQQNAALVEQSAAAAESLRDQAGRLSQAVGTFKLDPSGAPADPAGRPAAKPPATFKPVAAKSAMATTATKAALPVKPMPVTARVKPAVTPLPAASSKPQPLPAGKDDSDWESF